MTLLQKRKLFKILINMHVPKIDRHFKLSRHFRSYVNY